MGSVLSANETRTVWEALSLRTGSGSATVAGAGPARVGGRGGRGAGAAQVAGERVGDEVLPRAVQPELGRLVRALLEGVPHEPVDHRHVDGLGHDPGDRDVVTRVRDD